MQSSSAHIRVQKNATIAAAKVVLEAAVKAGAPEGIIGWIDVPSLELTNDSNERAQTSFLQQVVLEWLKQHILPENRHLVLEPVTHRLSLMILPISSLAVNSIIHSKTFDNGMICASEQSVTVLDSIYDEVKKEFAYRGCYFLKKEKSLIKSARQLSLTVR